MERLTYATEKAPAAIGPYSQAVSFGDIIYCSGQLPIDPSTGLLAEGIEIQTRIALQNLSGLLQSSRSNLASVLKTTVFMVDLGQFQLMNEVYGTFFPTIRQPARQYRSQNYRRTR